MSQEQRDSYVIPPNFIEGGSFFGGLFKARNVVEAVILAAGTGLPILTLSLTLTIRIILLCLTSLPLALLALIGIAGMPLSSYIILFFRFLRNRRSLSKSGGKSSRKQAILPTWDKKSGPSTAVQPAAYKKDSSRIRFAKDTRRLMLDTAYRQKKQAERPGNPLATYVPIQKIENGIVYTTDHRFIKILEIVPINFLLRSAREQRNIVYSFISYLKIAPVKLQIKVVTKRADMNRHIETVRREMAQETNESCRMQQEDYLKLLKKLGSREAIARRFFLIMEYEPLPGAKKDREEAEAISSLQTAARTAANYLRQCGNSVVQHENEDEAAAEMLYTFLCRRESTDIPFLQRISHITSNYIKAGCSIDEIPVGDFFAPSQLDFTHGSYLYIDGTYYAYLLVPSDGYKSEVPAGWLSLLVNAGDGIDLDVFLTRQPKDRMIRKLGQQLRINRSKIKETSDTNTDFDDLDSAIRSGYFLKDGLSNHEDFYYLNLLITVTADNPDDLDWKCAEMKKLLISQDMNVQSCNFCQEQALRSSFPLVKLDKSLFERSKRNVLTLGAASCYPFTAYELCDDNGILLGVNKHNNSLIIVDIFDSRIYKNANIAILGTSGSGKTFTMQLMALRMRRKGIQVFIVAPLKGHEFHRACSNIGGAFIQISPASPNCINVMEIRKIDHTSSELLDGPMPEQSELAAKIQKLHIFFSLLIPDLSNEERQLLDEAIVTTYRNKGITYSNASLDDPAHPGQYREMPILGDLHAVLSSTPETRRIANILNRLVHGSASSFNRQTNVNLDNSYVLIDISELSGDLLTVGMYIGLDYMWDKAKEDLTRRKQIFIDEVWQIIGASSNALAANYVFEAVKTIRGYGGGVLVATQDLNDFFSLEDGKYGRGILNNCKIKIILNLEEEEAQRVQSVLKLTDAEIDNITRFERGSALIVTNSNNVTVDMRCSEEEKDLITTDRDELRRIVERKMQNQTETEES